jgi:hypothetical protein
MTGGGAGRQGQPGRTGRTSMPPRADSADNPQKPVRTGIFGTGPHPSGIRVVGRYVHSYDPPARLPYPHYIPGMRPAHDTVPGIGHPSPTPIYDSLYAEYRRSFRALPGDRLGEEDLGFKPFGPRDFRGSWDHAAAEPERLHRRNAPMALPPGSRDNRGREH